MIGGYGAPLSPDLHTYTHTYTPTPLKERGVGFICESVLWMAFIYTHSTHTTHRRHTCQTTQLTTLAQEYPMFYLH